MTGPVAPEDAEWVLDTLREQLRRDMDLDRVRHGLVANNGAHSARRRLIDQIEDWLHQG